MAYTSRPTRGSKSTVGLYVSTIRDSEYTHRLWDPVAKYLQESLDATLVDLQVVDEPALDIAIAAGNAHFVILDPGHYLRLEAGRCISRLGSLRYAHPDYTAGYNHQTAVIFTRANEVGINQLGDLRNKSLIAVDAGSLRGFQMAWGELLRHGIDPYQDLSALYFSGYPEGQVVQAVRSGEVDAGTVESGLLADMIAQGEVASSEFKILNTRASNQHPFPHSTELFPSCVVAAMPTTTPALIQSFNLALARMSGQITTGIVGLDPVPDFSSVHALYRKLQIAPYDRDTNAVLATTTGECWPLIRAVSHDLRTPLNVILSLTDLMRDIYTGSPESIPEIQSYINEVYEAGIRMTELVFEATDFARLETGHQSDGFEVISLHDLAEELEDMLGEAAHEANVGFTVHAPSSWHAIQLPELRIKPVIFNLLYGMTRLRGTRNISVNFSVKQESLQVNVEWRGDSSTHHNQDGFWEIPASIQDMGTAAHQFCVWMFIGRRLVEAHGGRFWTQRQGTDVRQLHIEISAQPA